MHQSEKEKFTNCDLDVTHDQTFNWTKAKASRTSTTPPLKITMFLCFQTSFTESGMLLNWEKFNNGMLWNTLSTPNHAQQWFHNNQANLHSKNKWVVVSSSTPQRLHVELAAMIPRLSRLALVANLFFNTL